MKKKCEHCEKQYEATGREKFCRPICREEFNHKKRILKLKEEEEVGNATPTRVYREITEQTVGKAWLRLYRIDPTLTKKRKLKVIFKIDTTGKITISESLSHATLGRGDLFDEYTPPKEEMTWAGVIFIDSIITEFLSQEGAIKLALLFQTFDDESSKMKITQMIPKAEVPKHNTQIGHGSCRTDKITNVIDWINNKPKSED